MGEIDVGCVSPSRGVPNFSNSNFQNSSQNEKCLEGLYQSLEDQELVSGKILGQNSSPADAISEVYC